MDAEGSSHDLIDGFLTDGWMDGWMDVSCFGCYVQSPKKDSDTACSDAADIPPEPRCWSYRFVLEDDDSALAFAIILILI